MKTCSSCGQLKPLSAFLQLAGTVGTTYGNICSTCRKEKAKTKEPDEFTTSTTGNKIDAKMRLKDVVDKREQHKQVEEEYFEEREKEEKETKRFEKIDVVRKEEKQREIRSFLDRTKKTQSRPATPEKVFGGEDHRIKEEKLDFSTGPFEDTRVAGKVKYTQSAVWSAFKAANRNAPIVSQQEKIQRNQKESADKKATTEFTQEKFTPTSGSRRR